VHKTEKLTLVAVFCLCGVQVALNTHTTASGVDFYTVNPKGNVPTLVLDDGTILNENTATLQYIADQVPGTVAPLAGTTDRYLVQNALSYISSEVHGSVGPLFNPANTDDVKAFSRTRIAQKFQYLNDSLIGTKQFLVADKFSIADAYLYIVLSWSGYLQLDLSVYPNVKTYFDNIVALPEVKAAHEAIATNPTHIPTKSA